MTKLTFLEVSGSHADIGHAIGTKFRDKIQNRIKVLRNTVNDYFQYLHQTEPYFLVTKKQFPHLIEELEAVAQGAGVSVEEYFLLNSHEVYHRAKPWHSQPLRCTTIVSPGKEGTLVGHNEDWIETEKDDTYVLKATIHGTTFVCLAYCTELPGVAASLNSHGVSQCINDVSSPTRVGVPRNFVARAMLQAKNLKEAEKIIKDSDCASGYNHVLVQESGLCDVEVCESKCECIKDNNVFVHANHYLDPGFQKKEEYLSSCSQERYALATSLAKPDMTKDQMADTLFQVRSELWEKCKPSMTIGSIVIEPYKKQIHIRRYDYAQGDFDTYQL